MPRLDLGFDYGTIATLQTKTSIIVQADGSEQRIPQWRQPLLRFQVGQRGLLNQKLADFLQFHGDRKGALEPFRFRDWSDWKATGQPLGEGDGNKTQFQLFKTYSLGEASAKRPITRPVAATVKIYLEGEELTEGWTVNSETGVVTFAEAPTGTLTADFEFDVLVRFESDKIDLRFEGYSAGEKIYNWENLILVEVREYTSPITESLPSSLSESINLGYDYGTIGGPKFSTQIQSSSGGWENRSANWAGPKADWEIGERSLLKSELDYLITLFRICRGRATSFVYYDHASQTYKQVRFGEDSISFRFEAYEPGTGNAIYNLSGISLTESRPKIRVDSETYIVSLIDSSGSMTSAITPIEQALGQLKTLLKDSLYGGSQTLADKYFRSPAGFDDERYLLKLSLDYRQAETDAKKYLFLIFINEASNISEVISPYAYHLSPRNTGVEPTEYYLEDFEGFVAAFGSTALFNCLIVVPTSVPPVSYETAFTEHLQAAINGRDGYYPLANFNIEGKFYWNINSTSDDYYNLLIGYLGL